MAVLEGSGASAVVVDEGLGERKGEVFTVDDEDVGGRSLEMVQPAWQAVDVGVDGYVADLLDAGADAVRLALDSDVDGAFDDRSPLPLPEFHVFGSR